MDKINWQRVILGGLLAGVIINVVEWVVNGLIFAGDWASVMKDLNRSGTFSPKQIVALNLWGFLTGIAMIWLYAAIRPRYGAGPKTAACAGAAMWFMNYALGGVFFCDHAHVSAGPVGRYDAHWPGRGDRRGSGRRLALQGTKWRLPTSGGGRKVISNDRYRLSRPAWERHGPGAGS